MKKTIILISICLLFFLSYTAHAQQDSVLSFTLEEVQEYAVQHNTNAENARLDITQAEKDVWETTAMGLPQVNGSVGYTDNLSLMTTLIPNFFEGKPDELVPVQFGTQHNANATLSVSELIFSGPYIVGLQTSKIYKSLSVQTSKKTDIEVKATVSETFYLILMSEKSLNILQSNYENLEKTLKDTKAMYENGLVEETDADQLQISVYTLENSISSMKRQIATTKKLLNFQMGLPLGQEIALKGSLDDFIGKIDSAVLLTAGFSIEENIDYKLLDVQEKLSFMSMKKEKAEYLPSLSASFTHQQLAMRDQFNFFDFNKKWYSSSMLSFNLNIPIFSSGTRHVRVQKAELALQKARNNKESGRQSLLLAARQAKDNYLNAVDKYKTQQKNIDLARKILNHTTIKYKEGMTSSMEVTQANDQYLKAQSDYTSAMVALLNAKIDLDKAYNRL